MQKLGYEVAIVEKWNHFAKIRQDLYGIADLLGMRVGEPLLAVQTTVTEKLPDRMRKNPEKVAKWLSTGNRFEFWGWSQRGARGKRKLWTLDKRLP